MKGINVFIRLISVMVMFSMSGWLHSHDGHLNEDVILEEYGSLGDVNFPVSCSAQAQDATNTGVSLLHHMMYAQAEKVFSQWIRKEPQCAIFYWGYAMSLFHPLWPDKITDESLALGEKALQRATTLQTSALEKHYLKAANHYYKDWKTTDEIARIEAWAKAQQDIYRRYPDNTDAATFSALSELVTASKSDPSFSVNQRVGNKLQSIIERNPRHPGAIHYSIHAYDNPVLAHLGLPSARAYESIAPDVPHALHMPSHIFVRVGEWRDAVSWNARSAKAALKYPTDGETSMHYSHALDYLIYAQLQLGAGDKAIKVFREIDAHHPIQGTFPAAYALSAMRARIALEQQRWRQASQLPTRKPSYIHWEKFPQVEAITYFARGVGAARGGDLESARASVKMLDQLYLKTEQFDSSYWAPLIDAQRKAVSAWIKFALGEEQNALSLLRSAADIEDSLDKNPVTPGAVLPARDLLGDMLVLVGDSQGAVEAYQASLEISPQRRYSLSGIRKAKLKR